MDSHFSAPPAPLAAASDFQARIAALWVFPVKSCAGISVTQVVLTPTGLACDRAWMVVDAEGDMLTQRDLPRMALIQPELVNAEAEADAIPELVLHADGMAALRLQHPAAATPVSVRVWDDKVPAFDMGPAAGAWLTTFLGDSAGPLRLVRFDASHRRLSSAKWTQGVEAINQFSDGFPVLVSSTASLDALNARLHAQGEAAVDMRRFRANVVLGSAAQGEAVAAHDEDRIGTMHFATDDGPAVQLQPVKPCPRCPIPNINPDTAHTHPAVSDALHAYRQDPRVNGALTFGMNCMPLKGVGQVLRVGQRVSAAWEF
jgi:uncharacterized protein YcbX